MADRVAVMDRGRIAQVGVPEEVYERPATAFVARFLGEANLLAGTVRSVDASGAEVDLGGGATVRAPADPGLAEGAAVDVVVRPERISFGAAGLAATVEEVTFVGADVRVVARLASGSAVTVRRPADETPRPRVGDATRLVLVAAAVVRAADGAPPAAAAPATAARSPDARAAPG
jgi:ABC-type Fe3+/spermidine/putrescine transport system ATPase subunit